MLLKDLFNFDSYQSFFVKGGRFNLTENFLSVLNGLINIAFGFIKYLVLALDYVIDKLFNLNLLTDILPTLFQTAGAIYEKLFSTLGILLFTFVIVMVVKDFLTAGFAKALTRLMVFFLIYFGSLAFFADGASKLESVNEISQQAQSQLVDMTSGSMQGIKGSASDTLLGDTSGLDGTTKIRNLLFDEFVMKPYALMNFGEATINKVDYEEYLVKKDVELDQKQLKEIQSKVESDSEENNYLTSDRMTEKISVLLNTLIMLAVVGLAILFIGVANILIQLAIYALIFLFPTLLFFALIPNMHNLLKNGFMTLGLLFAGKVGIGLLFGLLFSILNVIDKFLPVTDIVSMFVGLAIKVVLGWLIWHNKGTIYRALTKGQVDLRQVNGFGNSKGRRQNQDVSEEEEEETPRSRKRRKTSDDDEEHSEEEYENEYRQNEEMRDNILTQASGQEGIAQHHTDSEGQSRSDWQMDQEEEGNDSSHDPYGWENVSDYYGYEDGNNFSIPEEEMDHYLDPRETEDFYTDSHLTDHSTKEEILPEEMNVHLSEHPALNMDNEYTGSEEKSAYQKDFETELHQLRGEGKANETV